MSDITRTQHFGSYLCIHLRVREKNLETEAKPTFEKLCSIISQQWRKAN